MEALLADEAKLLQDNLKLMREIMECESELGHGVNGADGIWVMSNRAESILNDGYSGDDGLEVAEALQVRVQHMLSQAQKADVIGAKALVKKAEEIHYACQRLVASEREIRSFYSHGYWDQLDYLYAHSGGYLVWQKHFLPIFKVAVE